MWSQIGYTFIATLTWVSTGTHVVWSSAAIPHLISGDVGYTITSTEASWVISCYNIGCILSVFYTKFAIDSLGRKITLISAVFMYTAGWVLLLFGNDVWYLYVGRTIAGLGYGTTVAGAVTYVSEIADNKIRGGLNTMGKFMLNVGQLLGYIIGGLTSYSVAIYIHVCITMASYLVAALVLPETPFFHIISGRRSKAEKVFAKLHSTDDKMFIMQEIDHIQKIVENDMKNEVTVVELFRNKLYRKGLIINLVVKALQSGSGFFVIVSYLQTIVDSSGVGLSPKLTPIMYAVFQLMIVLTAAIFIDKFGRKTLFLISLAGIAVAHGILGAYFYMRDQLHPDDTFMSHIKWLPIVSLMLFCVFYNIGLGPLTFILDGELFPLNVKAAAILTSLIFGNICSIGITSFYQISSDSWGVASAYWAFSGFMLLGFIFVIFVVPETKGKSFDVIQQELNKGGFFSSRISPKL